MRYSLLSRFRGTLLGAALGETLSQSKRHSQTSASWGRMAVLGAESLIELGRFDLEDWRDRFSRQSKAQAAMHSVSTEAIIAALPIAIFYHENEIKLRQNLLSLLGIWQDDLVLRDGTLAVGYAIAQALTEKLNPVSLIPQTIAFLKEPQTQLAQQLTQVQTFLEQGVGLERAVSQLNCSEAQPSIPIALAFYCFLSTLEDFRLSVLRAVRGLHQSKTAEAHILAPVLTGALSGAYNSTAGISPTLRLSISRPQATPLLAWGMKTEAEMLKLSESLVAVWSGVYDQPTYSSKLTPVIAIAAPQVMRLR